MSRRVVRELGSLAVVIGVFGGFTSVALAAVSRLGELASFGPEDHRWFDAATIGFLVVIVLGGVAMLATTRER